MRVADRFGSHVLSQLFVRTSSELIDCRRIAAGCPLIGLTVIWLLLRRGLELVPHQLEQTSARSIFHLARSAARRGDPAIWRARPFHRRGSARAYSATMGTSLVAIKLSDWLVHPSPFVRPLLLVVALVGLQYLATSLKISVEVEETQRPAGKLATPAARSCPVCDGDSSSPAALLVIAATCPRSMAEAAANWLIRRRRTWSIAAYGSLVSGVIMLVSRLALLLLFVAHGRELLDKRQFDDPVRS